MEVEFEQTAQDFVVVGEDVVRPAVSVTNGAVEGGMQFEQTRGEGGGIRFGFDGFDAFEDVEGVIEIGEGAVFFSMLPSPKSPPRFAERGLEAEDAVSHAWRSWWSCLAAAATAW